MKLKLPLLAGLALSGCVSLAFAASAELKPAPQSPEAKAIPLGPEKPAVPFDRIKIKNYQDESLGRIKDLGIDLVNGRIVEALIESDSSLNLGRKIVAVPVRALVPDMANEVYRLNISVEDFKAAAAVDLTKWEDAGRSERVASAYRRFGQEPYFLEEGMMPDKKAKRPKVPLGYVERASRIEDMPVANLKKEKLGKVFSMTLNIPEGLIINVIIIAPGNFKTKTIVPATALMFTDDRKGLLINETKEEFADEPRYIFTESALGNDAYSEEQPYKGPKAYGVLEQGRSYRDVDRTVQINRGIRTAKIAARNVQVGTVNGRVTMRGWVTTPDEKAHINAIAIAAAGLEMVDDQITVGKPAGN